MLSSLCRLLTTWAFWFTTAWSLLKSLTSHRSHVRSCQWVKVLTVALVFLPMLSTEQNDITTGHYRLSLQAKAQCDTHILRHSPTRLQPHTHTSTYDALVYPQTHAHPPPLTLNSHYILSYAIQICSCWLKPVNTALLIKHSFSPSYSPCHPHILTKQTYWPGFQGRIRAGEQAQLGKVRWQVMKVLTDMRSQFFAVCCAER